MSTSILASRWRSAWAVALCAVLAACLGDSVDSLVSSAQEHVKKKNYRAAVVQYKAALQKDGQNPELRLALGKAMIEAGDPVNAVLELTKAQDHKLSPDLVVPEIARAMLLGGDTKKLTTTYADTRLSDPKAIANLKSSLATAWSMLGDRAKSKQAIADALKAQPGYGPAIVVQARLEAATGDSAKALAVVDELLGREPSLAEAWHLKGDILFKTDPDRKKATQAYTKALEANRVHIPSHLSLIQLRLADKDLAGAKAQAAALREALPNHPQSIFVAAQIALADKDFTAAREHSQQLLKVAPNHTGVVMLAGSIEGQAGSLVMAQNHFAKALQLDPELLLARRNLAQSQVRMGQPQKALQTLQPALAQKQPMSDLYALAGEAHLQLGDVAAAEAAFKEALKLSPDDRRLRTTLALAALERGSEGAAFAELNKLSAQDSDTAADMTLVAVRMKRREFDQALASAQTMVKKAPNDAMAVNTLARVHLALKDTKAARTAFEEALKIEPRLFAATASLAALDVQEKKTDVAQKRYEEAIKLDPRNHLARLALAQLRAGLGAPSKEVNAMLTEAIKATPSEAAPRLTLINRLVSERTYKEALTAAQDAAAALPNDSKILDTLGRALAESGDKQQALSTFRRMTTLEPTSGLPLVRMADVHKSLGDRAAAESNLRRALEVEPDLVAAQSSLADLLMATNRSAEALAVARRLQQRRPKENVGYMFEASIQQRTKAPDAAIAALRKGLTAAPGDSELAVTLHRSLMAGNRKAEADTLAANWVKNYPNDLAFEYQLALATIMSGDFDGAETRLRALLAKRPGHALALNNLSWLLVTKGKPVGSVELARKANDILPGRPALMDTLAMAMAAENQAPAALSLQKEALAMSPNDAGLRLNLAKIALKAGDKELARKELKALEALGPTLPTRDEVLKLMAGL